MKKLFHFMKKLCIGILFASISLFATTENYKLGSPFQTNILHNKENIIPIAIIGGGPGGLSATFYASRDGYHTVLFQGE